MSVPDSDNLMNGPTIRDLYELKRHLHLKADIFCEVAGIPSTAFRRGKTVPVPPECLAKLERCTFAMDKAVKCFPESASTWFHSKQQGLAGMTPFEVALMPDGLARLEPFFRPVLSTASEAISQVEPSQPIESKLEVVETMENPDQRQFRIKGLLKAGCKKLSPSISLTELARRIQNDGLSKFTSGTASRLDLGYADASWNEIVAIAKVLHTTPYELAGLPAPRKTTAPVIPIRAEVVVEAKNEEILRAPAEAPFRGKQSSLGYSKLLKEEADRAQRIMMLPQKQLPPAEYRGWKSYREKVIALLSSLSTESVERPAELL